MTVWFKILPEHANAMGSVICRSYKLSRFFVTVFISVVYKVHIIMVIMFYTTHMMVM